jgi:hypothetical protein
VNIKLKHNVKEVVKKIKQEHINIVDGKLMFVLKKAVLQLKVL